MRAAMKRLLAALLLLTAAPAAAGDVIAVVPYAGSLTNQYASAKYRLDLADTGALRGVFAQWVSPGRFQANAFYYGSPDVNYSRVTGAHLNADWYPVRAAGGDYVLGGGLEALRIEMDAVKKIAGVDSLQLDNRVRFYYLRAGKYFVAGGRALSLSVLPYAGYAAEKVSGDLALDLPGPFPPVIRADLGDSSDYPIGGLNLSASYRHFIEAQAKWMGRFTRGGTLNEYSGLLNFYFSRHFGLSYRYKYMEYGSSSNEYHMGGLIVAL